MKKAEEYIKYIEDDVPINLYRSIVLTIKKVQQDAINEAAAVIKKEYPAGLTNTAKYVSDQVLKLKEDL